MLTILDYLLIHPLMILFDIIFFILYGLIENVVITIFALSFVVNLIVLPLYRKADSLQKEQHDKSLKMKKWTKHIRRNFSGDKRFFILSAYYRIEDYNPLSSLKEAVPLLLQIPFFIAAYRYISTIPILNGVSFGPVADLLKPDSLLVICGVTVNLLPIVMTVINGISILIYVKDRSAGQVLKLFSIAFVFLFLLYDSPSALVLYWIANNTFSLFKNIYFRYAQKYKHIIQITGPSIIVFLLVILFFIQKIDKPLDKFVYETLIFYVICKSLVSIAVIKNIKLPESLYRVLNVFYGMKKSDLILLMLVPEACLVILLGLYIPSGVLVSSPVEFISRSTGSFQSDLIIYPFIVYSGLLLLWSNVLLISVGKVKRLAGTLTLWVILGGSLFNFFVANVDVGNLYTDLSFDTELDFSGVSILINIVLTLIFVAVLLILVLKRNKIAINFGIIIAVALIALSFGNIFKIHKSLESSSSDLYTVVGDTPIVLSRTGENVVVIMLDRAISGYVPYIFEEKPELLSSYEGFVYYPNTVSFGLNTKFGSPGLFGGYEYTPYISDQRSDVTLRDKQNEALMLMPVLFMEEGYDVTVCDPPYANYQEIPDLSIYDDYPDINTYNLIGRYNDDLNVKLSGGAAKTQKHNFIVYSIFKTVPLFMRTTVYDNGDYLTLGTSYSNETIDNYSELWMLPELTSITDDDSGSFLMIQNSLPHSPAFLVPPDYTVDGIDHSDEYQYSNMICDGRVMRFSNDTQWRHYAINVATYEVLAQWLDYLKAEGVYDNTRIILVSDHSSTLWQFDDLIHPEGVHVEAMIPLLMVKDFYSNSEFSSDYTFMTNADVPTIAMQGVIDDPVNPFTGNPVDDSVKQDGFVIVTNSGNWVVRDGDATTFDLEEGEWWLVHDDALNMDNWTRYEE